MMSIISKLPDETIQLIAAGEIITRPVNAVKELLENSIDADATNIQIHFAGGGVKLVEIIDNGHGIARENAPLLCQRYTTSKLSKADDLMKIQTFGFRGEALASISELSELEVRTFNPAADKFGWSARYMSGKLVEEPVDIRNIQPGTHLKVVGLFKNFRKRKDAVLSCFAEEKRSIIDLVTRFALHHREKITVSLRDGKLPDIVCLLAPMKLRPCVGMFFGLEIENNLVEVQVENQNQYQVTANVAFSHKKLSGNQGHPVFVLFVNDRLVESNELKREVDALASEFLNLKQSSTFTYIDIKVPAADVDVNTHPAKATVTLHYQLEIIALIITGLREELSGKMKAKEFIKGSSQSKSIRQVLITTTSRTPISPQITGDTKESVQYSNAGGFKYLKDPVDSTPTPPISTPSGPSKRPHDLVHNDSSQRTLRQMTRIKTRRTSGTRGGEVIEPWPGIDKISPNTSRHDQCEPGNVSPLIIPPRNRKRDLKLRSISNLRELVLKEEAEDNRKIIKNSVFVGLFDHDHALIQFGTKLYAINFKNYLTEQYYQFYLHNFGNFSPIEILPPGNKIKFIISTYLEDVKKYEPNTFDKFKFSTPDQVVEKLKTHCDMLEDYIMLKFNEEEILTIPNILPDEVPNLVHLGRFLVHIANWVDFDREEECLKAIGRHLANFYSEAPANLRDRAIHKAYHDNIETKLYVCIKNYLIIPKWLFSKENICQISDTKDLYKVFERC